MNMLADEARTRATNARIVREALTQIGFERQSAGDLDGASYWLNAATQPEDVLLRLRGLIR